MTLKTYAFGNVGKGENAGNQHVVFDRVGNLILNSLLQHLKSLQATNAARNVAIFILTLYQRYTFRAVQTESICRQQNKCNPKIENLEFVLGRVENILITRCVCETPMPPYRPFFENCDLDIQP